MRWRRSIAEFWEAIIIVLVSMIMLFFMADILSIDDPYSTISATKKFINKDSDFSKLVDEGKISLDTVKAMRKDQSIISIPITKDTTDDEKKLIIRTLHRYNYRYELQGKLKAESPLQMIFTK